MQVAKILADRELIIWPLNQQLGRKPPINVNEAPLRGAFVQQEAAATGKRFSLVAYTSKARDKFPEDVRSQLRQAGFKLPRSTSGVSNGAKPFAMLGSEG